MVTTTDPNTRDDDLDHQARAEHLRTIVLVLLVVLGAAIIFGAGRATDSAKTKAVDEAKAKYTLAQQVAAACAISPRADDLGGLCVSAKDIVKEGPAGSTGLQGVAGSAGSAGSAGPLGPKGRPGDSIRGPQGAPGRDGRIGPPGASSAVPGPAGPLGQAGSDSTAPGPAGPPGPAGADSTVPGPQGPPGAAGADSTVPGPAGPAGQTPTAMTCTNTPGTNSWDCTVTTWRP